MTDDQAPTTSDESFIAAASDGAYTLLVADFADTETAWDAYEALKSIEDGRTVAIEGVVVVKREADGKLEIQKATDHSTRSGMRWGLVGGIALGVIFPPSIIGSAVVLGAAGAGAGKVRNLHHRSELADRAGERDRAWPLRDPRDGVRPRGRRDPQGAGRGRRHRQLGDRRRDRQGHQGRRQRGRRGRLGRRVAHQLPGRSSTEPMRSDASLAAPVAVLPPTVPVATGALLSMSRLDTCAPVRPTVRLR